LVSADKLVEHACLFLLKLQEPFPKLFRDHEYGSSHHDSVSLYFVQLALEDKTMVSGQFEGPRATYHVNPSFALSSHIKLITKSWLLALVFLLDLSSPS
jgi:hypothetical protein